ncbi:uncharacterized protein LAESUDRAFT_763550 [Laetiporus sulphureus 93-53]|uniref:F-box domain-containing protein n=1 Tax=Laetiporus sulphureus 93-53 TaxID=1314785 RepID=A0A165BUM9_9APHY|nr:uncharacterized protein LAESUDRAFT_763550 [Laetiporus sulphureus 93-53]KZT01687.1 hypothetical protein LAESUDRAFT_763550 [Laetiporus sulphureus 93-53]
MPSLEQSSVSDLIKMRSSKLEQRDTRQRARELKHLDELIKAVGFHAERRDCNARVAINRLPAEVLREIFTTSCTVKLAQYRSLHYYCNDITTIWNPTWIEKGRAVTLMLVCYHWKEIALEIQELWKGVESYWGHQDHTLLERSGRGPLKVLIRGDLEPSCAVAHVLHNVEHSSRIQELYWILGSAHKDLRMPAPSLRSLALRSYPSQIPDESLKLFGNHTPCLERLSLSCAGWLPSNAFANLTSLAIEYCYVTKSCAKIRSLLAGTLNLVDLILRDVAGNNFPHVRVEIGAASMKSVSLAQLRRLLIEDMRTDDIDYVFRDARLNEDLSVSIKHRPGSDEQRLLEVVSTWSLNALKQPKELHFQQHVAVIAGASSGFRFEVRRSMTLEDWTTLDWPRILPLSSISHLCVFQDARRLPGLERVYNLFGKMTVLQTLSVNIDGLTEIVDALTSFRDPIDPPLCPTLTTLRIVIWKDSDCDIILDSVLPHRAQLGVKHLYIGLIDPQLSEDWRPRQVVEDQFHGKFESVNFEMLLSGNEYGITLPPVCDEEAHALWTPWL